MSASRPVQPLLRPPRLHPGDRVAVVAPSGPVEPASLAAGCDILRSWGLDVACAPHVNSGHGILPYLAGADAERAADLQGAWLDPSIAAVLCARGGYGVQRMVDLLDWPAMQRAKPKAFAGFSDVTVLHEVFGAVLGVSTLFGPMVASETFRSDVPTQEGLRRTLFDPDSVHTLTSESAETLIGGRATGVTIGGTVTLLAASRGAFGTQVSAAGGIVVLEDVTEGAYRLDRHLTQLLRSGWFDAVAGIALGSWVDCEPAADVKALAIDRLGGLGVPIVWDLGFGHCPSQLTVPLGVRAELDADACTLRLLDPPLL